MKIASILSQYLFTKKHLDIPGIGYFMLDSKNESEDSNSPNSAITFSSDTSVKVNPDLISYISEHTGKMKPLAAADFDSHIQLAQQFLNIGKPFLFEGVGTLVLAKTGEYIFHRLPEVTDKAKDSRQREAYKEVKKEEPVKKYQSFLDNPAPVNKMRKPILVSLAVVGLLLAVWGGYAISKKNSGIAEKEDETKPATEAVVPVTPAVQIDSNAIKQAARATNYKYILEVAKSPRAFKRYKQLRTNLWDVQLETRDSIQYKLYMLLPAVSDTTRVLDSLTVMTGRRVYIETQNN